jgi:hypothetical protein
VSLSDLSKVKKEQKFQINLSVSGILFLHYIYIYLNIGLISVEAKTHIFEYRYTNFYNIHCTSKCHDLQKKLGRTVLDTYNLCLPLMQLSVQQPISKDKNVMVWTRKYYLTTNLRIQQIFVTIDICTD